ncbi:flavoprotein [Saccharopolyspora sp. 5N708]|uniref:flavoprotein n=1 Tax=Saccharopolyspora sp. 5N708 TaxID=3457424 RepID=UPI003FD4D8B7
MRLIVGITGATGAPIGVRLLEVLHDMPDVETHLVMSRWARTTIELETPYTAREVALLADVVHGAGDQAAPISSGSSVGDIVDHLVSRVLDQFALETPTARRWTGLAAARRDNDWDRTNQRWPTTTSGPIWTR